MGRIRCIHRRGLYSSETDGEGRLLATRSESVVLESIVGESCEGLWSMSFVKGFFEKSPLRVI